MKRSLLALLMLLVALPLSAARPRDVANLHDVDLVYYGSRYRSIAWDEDWARTHVAYTDTTGQTHYLFDTFLLLELHTGTGRFFEPAFRPTHPRNEIGTTKQDWIQILDTMLQVPVRNIDRALSEVAREIGRPKYKRQVIMFIPVPTEDQTNWGSINDRELDFHSTEDRIEACRWFIDLVRERFKEEKFKNLSLAGFYWLAEDKNSGLKMLPELTAHIRSLGMKTIWIPYYKAAGAAEWRQMGFDAAYYQPNYAFPRRVVYRERLYDAVKFAKQHDMYMELEYDMHAVKASNPDPYCADRLIDYMEVFTETGMADGPIAYYQDEGALWEMKNSPDAVDRALYHRFASFVAERQRRLMERK
ncbi:MAG: DUF4855 domain-containing protein [Rikenellaceae bacterium]|nr:DUF4855 domain-containing protein [Rikenellaceae bacterium]